MSCVGCRPSLCRLTLKADLPTSGPPSRYPRPLYTGQLDESVKELLNTLVDALTDHKAVVIFINPFVAYRKGTVVRVKITVYPEDLEGEPEFGHRALGFFGTRFE